MGLFNEIDKGLEHLNVNKAINGAYDFLSKGFEEVGKNYKAEADIGKAIKGAYYDADKGLKVGNIAGSYLAASGAYRLASGGGLYRDKNGNTNLIGVPFI